MSITEAHWREVALTVTCPVCEAAPTQECANKMNQNVRPKYRPHYLRYELARERAAAKASKAQDLLLSLGHLAPPNSTAPRSFRLQVEDETTNKSLFIELDEHQFCLFLGNHVVKVKGEWT